MFRFTFIFSILFCFNSSAASLFQCSWFLEKTKRKEAYYKFLENNYDEMSKARISDEQMQRLAKMYAENPDMAPRYNFELQLEKLISDLPTESRAKIADILENHYKLNKSTKTLTGAYNYTDESLRITIPEEFFGTDLEYFIKTHEAYHLVSDMKATLKLQGQKTKDLAKFYTKIKGKYLEEASAMMEEWQYIASVPHHLRVQFAEKLEKALLETRINKQNFEFIVESFKTKAEQPLQYLKLQHDVIGRYSLEQVKRQTRIIKIYNGAVYTILGGSGIFAINALVCISSEMAKATDSEFFEYFCRRSPLLSGRYKK